MPAHEHQLVVESEWISIAEYHERLSLRHLAVPSEEQQGRPEEWLDELEAKRAPEQRTSPEAALPAGSAEVPVIRCVPYAGHVPEGDDPDEVSVDDM